MLDQTTKEAFDLLLKYLYHPFFLNDYFLGYRLIEIFKIESEVRITVEYIEKNFRTEMLFIIKEDKIIRDMYGKDILAEDLRDDPHNMSLREAIADIYS